MRQAKQRTDIIKQLALRTKSIVTRLAVDTELLKAAIESDSQATIETVVETALREYIRRRQQLMVGAAEADRGELLDGETAMRNLQQKLNQWRAEAEA